MRDDDQHQDAEKGRGDVYFEATPSPGVGKSSLMGMRLATNIISQSSMDCEVQSDIRRMVDGPTGDGQDGGEPDG